MDIEAVVNKIKTLSEVDTSKIGICGYSMPAFQAFPVFSKRSDLKCFVGGALSANLDSIKSYWGRHVKNTLIPDDYTREFYPQYIADTVIKPCLLIVGELDEITPLSGVEQIYKKLKGPKEIWVIKGVGHGLQFDKNVGLRNYALRMIAFYNQYLLQLLHPTNR